jgi:hypothetical protein
MKSRGTDGTGGLKMLNSGGIKMSNSRPLTSSFAGIAKHAKLVSTQEKAGAKEEKLAAAK